MDLNEIAAFCIGEKTQIFFVLSLSHGLRFTGVQGRFLASLEMTIRGKRYSRFAVFRIGGRGTRQRRSGTFVNRLFETLFSLVFIPPAPYPSRFARHLPHAGKAYDTENSMYSRI